ncbi:MAG: hypothetical protein ACRET8_06305, partial [Burkholderiales bacterium]
MPGGTIAKPDLFARLAQGHAAGITVVTPNQRLAQVLRAEFDFYQANHDKTVWEDADILPVGALVQRLYEDSLYAESAGELPQLLTAVQERQLWEAVLEGAELLSVAQTAADCAAAWRLAHAWRIDGVVEKFQGNDDTRAFAGWAKEYRKRCEKGGYIDAARLPDLKFKLNTVVAYGFDILPPQTREFLGPGALACRPERKHSTSLRVSFPSSRHELAAAAGWARARLEEGKTRIGVVVPGLEQRRREVKRVFARAMNPGHALPGAAPAALPFNLSLGEPLAGDALVACALGLLEFCFADKSFEEVSRLLRSPFIGGADAEMLARAQLDARLRSELGTRVSLARLLSFAGPCPVLRKNLEKIFERTKQKESRSPHDWAQRYIELLAAAGFPGERGLDSNEFQARAKFEEALGEFARLGLVCGKFSAYEA